MYLRLTRSFFFSRFPRRTKDEEKHEEKANEEGGKSRTHLIIYVSTLVEGNDGHIHSVRA